MHSVHSLFLLSAFFFGIIPVSYAMHEAPEKFALLNALPADLLKDSVKWLREQGQACVGSTCKEFSAKDDGYRVGAKENTIVVPANKEYRKLSSFIDYLNKYARVQIPTPKNKPESKSMALGTLITKIDLGSLQAQEEESASVGDVLNKILEVFPHLQELRLMNANLKESDFKILGELKNLKVLNLGGTSFYHPGIKHLANLTEVRRLILSAPGEVPSNFDPAAQFRNLSQMRHLVYFYFTQSPETVRAFQDWILLNARDESNGFASYRKAVMHEYGTHDGKGPPVDTKLAIVEYERAAALEHPLAQTRLANLYLKGIGFKQDLDQAYKLFEKARLQGIPEAERGYWTSILSMHEKFSPKFTHWLSQARSDRPAHELRDLQARVGQMYLRGMGVEQDIEQAVYWLRKAALLGSPDAQNDVGFMYLLGLGVDPDKVEGVKMHRKAAEQGYAVSQSNMGTHYEEGVGVDQNDSLAFEWYQKGAEQGLVDAQNNLGRIYYSGIGVNQDRAQAAEWYRRAAEQGDPTSQFNLGSQYFYGRGVSQDFAQALEWFMKAAGEDDRAQLYLGFMYEMGRGVDSDLVRAVEWYKKAADQGNDQAQNNLGGMYQYGRGVDQDDDLAMEWYRKAAEQGLHEAQNRLAQMCAQIPLP